MPHGFSDDRPRVSVLLPVLNAERFLGEAVESILSQEFRDFELCALDDGSDDQSIALLRGFAGQDGRVRVFTGERQGVAKALNRLVHLSRGQFLARMDADDISLPGRISAQVKFLERNPDCVAVGGTVELMDAAGRPIGPSVPPLRHDEIDAANLSGRVSLTHPAVMMRACAVRAVGGYDPEFTNSEDLDLWLRLAELGRLANLPQTVLRYRLHDGSVSAADQADQEAWCRRACEAAWRRRGISGEFRYSRWRPGEHSAERLDYKLKLGWRSWKNGHRATWRRFALSALREAPTSSKAWRLAVMGLIRRPYSQGDEMT